VPILAFVKLVIHLVILLVLLSAMGVADQMWIDTALLLSVATLTTVMWMVKTGHVPQLLFR